MKKGIISARFFCISLFLFICLTAYTEEIEIDKVRDATAVITEIHEIPDNAIPLSMLNNAYGVAVVPDLLKVGFFIGGRHGQGIMVIRTDKGTWSNPFFITLSGVSVGWQIGAQSTDIVLVFKSRKSIDGIMQGKFTLGVDAAIAAGPLGRQAEASTDIELEAEIYSYAQSKGLFAGLTIEGSFIQIDHSANAAFYNVEGITPEEIVNDKGIRVPAEVGEFLKCLRIFTHEKNTQEDNQRTDI